MALASDRDPLTTGVETHEKPTCRRHHGDAEAGPGIRLGALAGLLKIIERAVHVKRAVGDSQQDRGALGMTVVIHDVELPRLRVTRVASLLG